MTLHCLSKAKQKGCTFLADCTLYEVQVSIPGESDLLNNYVDYVKRKKELQEIFNMVQVNPVIRGFS